MLYSQLLSAYSINAESWLAFRHEELIKYFILNILELAMERRLLQNMLSVFKPLLQQTVEAEQTWMFEQVQQIMWQST